MTFPIVDLHCDLLYYLRTKPNRTTLDPLSRCSLPQLSQGGVKLQTLAIFALTDSQSVKHGQEQVDWFQRLIKENTFTPCQLKENSSKVQIIAAFENAAAFSDASESLEVSLKRLASYLSLIGPIFYISLTWDGENRFGGGVGATVGLKEDGKRLLEWMSAKQIAADLSHTSDRLAYEMIEFIDKHDLETPLIASHSNFRAITPMPRNLPDDIAKEIIHRKGLIGFNFFAPFITKHGKAALLDHLEYGLSLGGEDTLCFGADFFCDADSTNLLEKYNTTQAFFPEYGNASCYPHILKSFAERLNLSEDVLRKIASQNALEFLLRTGDGGGQ